MPTISIIMPVYGVEKYIATAIESVLAQTFADWELIVVDDGSKDNSRVIALQYAVSDSRIKVCDKENGGLSDARNFGLNIAKGQYVHFFDSDDRIASDFYERMLKPFIKDSTLDFIITGFIKEHFVSNGETKLEQFKVGCALSPANLESQFFNYAWNKLFKREFIEQHNLRFEYGLKLIEDIEFMSRIMLCNPKYQFVDYGGYYYAIRQRTTLSKYFDEERIKLTARRQSLMEAILNSWELDKDVLAIAIEECKLRNIMSLLHSLFDDCAEQRWTYRKKYVTMICSDYALQPNLNIHLAKDLRKKFIRRFVSHKNITLLTVMYTFQKYLSQTK